MLEDEQAAVGCLATEFVGVLLFELLNLFVQLISLARFQQQPMGTRALPLVLK